MKTIDKIMIGGIGFGLAMTLTPLVSRYLNSDDYVLISGPVIIGLSVALGSGIKRAYEKSYQSKLK